MKAANLNDPWVPRACRLLGKVRESPDTSTLELEGMAGEPMLARPGQFNMLYAFGVGEIAVSVSGDPADLGRLVHTVRAVGAVSRALVGLPEGALIGVRGPFGTSWPLEAAHGADVLIVAGGLGLAPLRSVIYQVLAQRGLYRRLIILIGMRRPEEILYQHQLEHWRAGPGVELEITVDHADADWRGHAGVVSALVPQLKLDPLHTIAMVCGPEIMMRFSANALRDVGVPLEQIYLSMERNMKCAIGLCGHCQFGASFLCRDGAVMPFARIASLLTVPEI